MKAATELAVKLARREGSEPAEVYGRGRGLDEYVDCIVVGANRMEREPGETIDALVWRAASLFGTAVEFYLGYPTAKEIHRREREPAAPKRSRLG